MLTCNLYKTLVGILGNAKSIISISLSCLYDISSSMNIMSRVLLKFTLPCIMIFTVSPISIHYFTSIAIFCCCFFILSFNYSSEVFTSWICSKIKALWFSTFSHMSRIRSSIFVAIKSMSSCINDVSIAFMWAFAFFLEPLGCSHVLFLGASAGSDASGICVSMSVSFPNSSSMATSCSSVYTSSPLTCPVDPLGACSVASGPYVGPRCDLFCVLFLFQIDFLSPIVPIVVYFYGYHHSCLSDAWGLCYPTYGFVLLEFLLEYLTLSTA
jgi:hypothetical protein